MIKKVGFAHNLMIILENNVKTTTTSKIRMDFPAMNNDYPSPS